MEGELVAALVSFEMQGVRHHSGRPQITQIDTDSIAWNTADSSDDQRLAKFENWTLRSWTAMDPASSIDN
jgi:hypothetical protein